MYPKEAYQALKRYILVFICFSIIAIRLDISKALDTEECLKILSEGSLLDEDAPSRSSLILEQVSVDLSRSNSSEETNSRRVQDILLPDNVRDFSTNWTTIDARASKFRRSVGSCC